VDLHQGKGGEGTRRRGNEERDARWRKARGERASRKLTDKLGGVAMDDGRKLASERPDLFL
jgi:hypothetical protein